MKIITPPAINNLEELLEVVLHPKKLADALKQLADMKASIVTHLDLYATKDKADDYLSQAQVTQAEAAALRSKAEALVKEKTKTLGEAKANIAKVQEELRVRVAKHDAAMTERERTLTVYAEGVKAKELECNVREMALQARDAELARLEKKVTVELDKIEQRKAALSAIG